MLIIVKTPQGESPLPVRQALVGMKFDEYHDGPHGYQVPVGNLIEMLRLAHKTDAAQWLSDHFLRHSDHYPINFAACKED